MRKQWIPSIAVALGVALGAGAGCATEVDGDAPLVEEEPTFGEEKPEVLEEEPYPDDGLFDQEVILEEEMEEDSFYEDEAPSIEKPREGPFGDESIYEDQDQGIIGDEEQGPFSPAPTDEDFFEPDMGTFEE